MLITTNNASAINIWLGYIKNHMYLNKHTYKYYANDADVWSWKLRENQLISVL